MLKTTIVLISHQSPPEVAAMCRTWQRLNPEAALHVAYGGTEAGFANLRGQATDAAAAGAGARAIAGFMDRLAPDVGATWIPDPRLRTRDHQRERQSYLGVMRETARALAGSGTDRVLMVECDVMPLRAGLIPYLLRREQEENAQMLGTRIRRIDGTSHPHFLAHQAHPRFQEWLDQSIRPDKNVVMMMMGCLTWWTWEAFAAVAETREPLPVYLELAMPTAAHHLGYRVRNLPELDESLEPLGEVSAKLEQWTAEGRWVAHPCKRIWQRDSVIG